MNFRGVAIDSFLVTLILCCVSPIHAREFQIEKQKLKLAMEYENFVDEVGNEVRTPGVKATYLLKTRAEIAGKLNCTLDLQTGLKSNLDTTFEAGELSRMIWSNRVNLQATAPVGRFYFGGGFYFRNKWLAEVPRNRQFVDVFGGVGFQEISGSLLGGFNLSPKWDLLTVLQKSDLEFDEFPLSDSKWRGVSVRLGRKFENFRVNTFFRARNVDFNRPVFRESDPIVFPRTTGSTNLQQDRFREGGVGVEFSRPFYLSGTYSYQVNNSNNPGFSYRNHQISLLIGTELSHDWHIQAYGIVQRYDFLNEQGFLPFPLLVGENDDNNMAASLVRVLSTSAEIELGIQRLTHSSSFAQLNASKTILYAAYNHRF